MLRGRALNRAARVLALALLWALPVAADNTIGGSCSSVGQSGNSARNADGNNEWCNGTTWQYPAYQFGSTTASCSSTTAGQVQYTSGVLEACVATGSTYTWISISSGMQLISTQTASSSASLQFTNLPTNYNTLFLNCAGLEVTTNGTSINVYPGESTGPTWETASDYFGLQNSTYNNNGTLNSGGYGAATGGGSLLNAGSLLTGYPVSIKMYIDNPSSTTVYKNAISFFGTISAGIDYNMITQWTYWYGDKGAFTGLELVASGGGSMSSGTCSLYGMN